VSRGKELLCNRKAFTWFWDSPNPVELAFRHLTFPGGTKKGIKGDVAQHRRRQAGFFYKPAHGNRANNGQPASVLVGMPAAGCFINQPGGIGGFLLT